MSSFLLPDTQLIEQFLSQYPLAGVSAVEATYIARNHLTCRFRCSLPNPGRYLLVSVVPGAKDRLDYAVTLVNRLVDLELPVTPVVKPNADAGIRYGGNPALLFQLPEGEAPKYGDLDSCRQIGTFLGKMHAKSRNGAPEYCNPRSLVWLTLAAEELNPSLSAGEESLLREQLQRFRRTLEAAPELPSGPLIGSIFPDQLFFLQGRLQAVTGFFFSCTDWFLLDVAQAANEWCCNAHGDLDKHLCQGLLEAYSAERPFTPAEGQYWQDILCFSATRFWISRLLNNLEQSAVQSPKSPGEYKEKLQRRLINYVPLPI